MDMLKDIFVALFYDADDKGNLAVSVGKITFWVLLVIIVIIVVIIKNWKKIQIFFTTAGRGMNYGNMIEKHDEEILNINYQLTGMTRDIDGIKQEISNTREEVNIVSGKIDKLVDSLDTYIEKDKERTIITYRNALWNIHKVLMRKGFVTPSDLKNFNEILKEYEECGGNDIVHHRIIPEIHTLPIKYDDVTTD